MIFCFLICKIFFPFAFQYLQKIVNIRLLKNDLLNELYLNIFSRLVVESVIVVEIWEENILQVVQVVILMTLVLFKLQM